MCAETNGTTLEQLRDSVTDLPTIPETLSQILELLEDPNSGARDLAEVIRNDAPLAAKILRLANSPLYQKNRTITTVQECVAVLGYRTVRQVALCVAVVSSLGAECDQKDATLNYRDLWRHCVASGAVAQYLARKHKHPEPEGIFTCGLLHDLGKFVLTLRFPRQYSELVVERCRRGCLLVDLEREILGYDHAQAGAVLADAWHFPPNLVAAIGGHHDPAITDRDVGLVAAADYLANLLDPSASDLGFDAMLIEPTTLYAAAGLEREVVEAELDDMRDAIAAASPLRNLE
jgi:putative nucleotidyltransferase with HDIG domain